MVMKIMEVMVVVIMVLILDGSSDGDNYSDW
jgi:hypothetical protein